LYLETLQSRPVEEDRRQEFYKIMLEDSDRLLGTIEQILSTGRIGHARRHLHLSTVDFGTLVEECLVREQRLYHLPADAMTFRPGAPTNIRCDADEVRAAVSNLIDNAIKYAGREPKVEIELNPVEGGNVAIKVKDNGPGIAKDEVNQIFKRFYRVRGPQSTRIKGTGLGLFIVRSVAKRHGGKAWVESNGNGRGSTFVLQLPVGQ
jgi:signal transduction histidine kinase